MTMRGHRVTIPGARLFIETCSGCGLTYGMTEDFEAQRRRDGRDFYCPAGHSQHYAHEKNAQQKLAAANAATTAARDQAAAAIRDAERNKAALVRDRWRFVNGVCPCCTRSFENVRRHMETKHPDYDVHQLPAAAKVKGLTCSCGAKFGTPRGLAIHQGHMRADGWDQPNTTPWRSHLTVV